MFLHDNLITRPDAQLEHGEPPMKTVQPQDIWLCLGRIIRNLDVVVILLKRGK
jgi:hypothetical protein